MLEMGILLYFIYVMMVGAIAIHFKNVERIERNRKISRRAARALDRLLKEEKQLEERQHQKKTYWHYMGWW